MAAKDSNEKSKTSKTARVMNLLSKKHDPAPEEPVETAAESTPVPPIISSMAPDAAVSGQIKDALTDFLESELGVPSESETEPAGVPPQGKAAEPAPAAEPVPTTEPVPEAEPIPAAKEPEAPADPPVSEPQDNFVPLETLSAGDELPPVETSAPQEEPPIQQDAPAVEESPAPAPAPTLVQQPSASLIEAIERGDAGTGYVNVMQVLVEEKAEKYVKMFGLCDCERCLADVKALALNHLPPKYVVMDQGERVPKLTFYEGKFDSEIITQLVQACKKIMQTPHHDRNH